MEVGGLRKKKGCEGRAEDSSVMWSLRVWRYVRLDKMESLYSACGLACCRGVDSNERLTHSSFRYRRPYDSWL